MNIIKRLFGHKHDWKFAYNHGVPRGTSMSIGEVIRALSDGRAYGVYQCTKCPRQARLLEGEMTLLPPSEMETP